MPETTVLLSFVSSMPPLHVRTLTWKQTGQSLGYNLYNIDTDARDIHIDAAVTA